MTGTSRPLDSGRKDALGRVVRVSGQDVAARADAPLPPAETGGFNDDDLVAEGVPDDEWEQPEGRSVKTSTPWGGADFAYKYATGINSYSTPGHGGFKLSATRNAEVPDGLRNDNGWYEEDTEWAAVAYTFPDAFPRSQVREAIRVLRDWHPDEWEAATGEHVTAEQSHVVAEREFHERHKHDPIVVSAIGHTSPSYGFYNREGNEIADQMIQDIVDGTSDLTPNGTFDRDQVIDRIISETISRGGQIGNGLDRAHLYGLVGRPLDTYLEDAGNGKHRVRTDHPLPIIRSAPEGQVLVRTQPGGRRGDIDEPRSFLVPADEYRNRDRFGFVVDETRHQEVKVAE